MSISNKFYSIAITSGLPALYYLLEGRIDAAMVLGFIAALAISFAREHDD